MAYSSKRTISIEQLLSAIQRHKLIGLFTFAVVFGAVVLAWLFLPQQFGSSGRLSVAIGRANTNTNNSMQSSGSISIQDSRETGVRSVVELIKSENVIGQVVDRVGADNILKGGLKLPVLGKNKEFDSEDYKKQIRREQAIKKLTSDLDVFSEKKTAVISVYCRGSSPLLAQQIVNAIMEIAQSNHVNIHAASQSQEFFARSFDEQREKLEKAEEVLRQYRDSHQFLTVEDARNTENGIIDKLKSQIVDVKVLLSQSIAMASELKRQLSQVEERIEMPTEGMESLSTEGAEQLLNAQVAELAKLKSRYKDGHPQVIEKQKEVARLRTQFSSLPSGRIQTNMAQNPVYESLKINLVTEESRVKSLERQLSELKVQQEETNGRMIQLNKMALDVAKLKREVSVAQKDFDLYALKRSEMNLIGKLDKEAISDIVIWEPGASLILKKHSPQGSIMLPMGFCFATLCGLMVALLADRKNLIGLSSDEEIEEALEIPVLVTVPRVHSSRVQSH